MLAITSTINAFFDDFSSGRLDESSTHWVLIIVIALAEISLGVGIWIESPKNKSFREWMGVGLVLIGCFVSALFTVLLLIFDEGISHSQQSTIIALDKQISRRWLTLDECRGIQHELSSMAGRIEVVSYTLDLEAGLLATQLVSCLGEVKTLNLKLALASVTPIGGFGVGIFVSGSDKKLVDALRSAISIQGGLYVGEGSGFFVGNQQMAAKDLPGTPPITAFVLVAVKPIPEMLQTMRRRKRMRVDGIKHK